MARIRWHVLALLSLLVGSGAEAEDKVLNLYSARHYQTDETLYDAFTAKTGIKIRRIEGKEDELVERITQEGEASPADIFLTVDAGRLWRADQAGLFQPVHSAFLDERIPANLRHPDGHWFGFAMRARVIFYDRASIDPAKVRHYADLADPAFEGQVCMRSSTAVYNLSLMASMIEEIGTEAAQAWANGVVANFARPPQGGDIEQIKAIAAGECKLALGNTYYWVRLAQSANPDERALTERVGVIFPDQDGRGTHVNISGAGMLKTAPHPQAALAFLEYLASDDAQRYFTSGSDEYPVVPGLEVESVALKQLGPFKADPVNVAVYGTRQPEAQIVYDLAGWK